MSFLNNIKEKIGWFLLIKKHNQLKRFPVAINLLDAKSVGVVFDSSNKDDYELVKKYVNYLKEMNKKVKVVGYFSNEYQPNISHSKLEYDFFTYKELNWKAEPTSPFVKNFLEEEFDVLIDMNINAHFPLSYISAESKAKFKVGKFSAEKSFIYDLMIETKEDQSFKYYLRQMDAYLLMINKQS